MGVERYYLPVLALLLFLAVRQRMALPQVAHRQALPLAVLRTLF
jgi:hypothetical protein